MSKQARFDASLLRALFQGPRPEQNLDVSTWDALPNGEGFVFVQDHATPRTAVDLVIGWFGELRELERDARR